LPMTCVRLAQVFREFGRLLGFEFRRSPRRLCGWSASGWRRWTYTGQGCLCHCPCDLKLILGRWSAALPESLFLKALTEGSPVIRPRAVDICRRMMVRYSVMYGVTR